MSALRDDLRRRLRDAAEIVRYVANAERLNPLSRREALRHIARPS